MKLKKRGDGDTVETPPLDAEKPKSRRKSQESVIIYITLLFTAAFLLILLSYFMHTRKSESEITSLTEQHTEFKLQAQQDISELQTQNIELKEELTSAQQEIEELSKKLASQKSEYETQQKNDNEKYDALYKSLIAMDRLVDLQEAFRAGDEALIEIGLASMEEYAEYLDGHYTQLYEDMKEHPENYLQPPSEEEPTEEENTVKR